MSEQPMDPYEILGVPSGSSDDEIKGAFRKQARTAHPDAGGSTEEFQRIQGAYEKLVNEPQRQRATESEERYAVKKAAFDNEVSAARETFLDNPHLRIIEEDLPLLAALDTAYGTQEDGVWETGDTGKDAYTFDGREKYGGARYRVEKRNGQVNVGRRMSDVTPFEIEIRKRGDYQTVVATYNSSEDFVPVSAISGKDGITSTEMPGYDTYVDSMKSLAKRANAGSNFTLDQDGPIINAYTKTQLKGSGREIAPRLQRQADRTKEYKERTVVLKSNNFWSEIQNARKAVKKVE